MKRYIAALAFSCSVALAGTAVDADKAAWAAALSARIESHWLRPPVQETGEGPCRVRIALSDTGSVRGIRIEEPCKTRVLERSIIRAIARSFPLPLPSKPAAFEEEVLISFHPKDGS